MAQLQPLDFVTNPKLLQVATLLLSVVTWLFSQCYQALHEDVLKHQQPIRSLVYQSEQLVEHHQEELTPEQVTELQNLESVIKTSFGKVTLICIGL